MTRPRALGLVPGFVIDTKLDGDAPPSPGALGDGLYGQSDLAGNVWEWVQDWYWNYQSSCDNCSGTPFPPSPPYRVIRGGSFGSNGADLLTSRRLNLAPSDVGHGYGARCARAP